jgi:hypothetical protein
MSASATMRTSGRARKFLTCIRLIPPHPQMPTRSGLRFEIDDGRLFDRVRLFAAVDMGFSAFSR